MKKFLSLLLIAGLLSSFAPAFAEEEISKLDRATIGITEAIRLDPISLPRYVGSQVDFWAEVLKRFIKTAKPMVAFKDKAYPGLEVTVYEQPKWCVTWGKVYQIEDGEIVDQPSFWAIEARDFPFLSDLAEIFKKIRPQVVYVDKRFWFGLSYELTEE